MNNRKCVSLIVLVVLAGAGLSGCIGASPQTSTGPQAESPGPDDNQTPPSGDEGTPPVDDNGSLPDEEDETSNRTRSYRTPSDAMEAQPAETQNGMAKFEFQQSGPTNLQGLAGEAGQPTSATFSLDNPGDITFFDIHVTSDDHLAESDVDYDLYLYRGNDTSGEPIASNTESGTHEYMFWKPKQDQAQTFTIEVRAYNSIEASWTMSVWVWTHPDWSANHPWTDVWTGSYEFGQAGSSVPACSALPVGCWAALVSAPAGTEGAPASNLLTQDGSYDIGGYWWDGCDPRLNGYTNPNASGARDLPCPHQEVYDKVSVIVNDDVAGQQVAATWTTCADDGDFVCGETDNLNDDSNPGPNELTATFCGVVDGITRDGTTDKDGTGVGVWDQRGEQYENANGTYVPHPGVWSITVFLRGPQEGGNGICPDASPYTAPTAGTITMIGET